MLAFEAKTAERFKKVGQRFDRLDGKVDAVDRKIDGFAEALPGIVGDAVREASRGRDKKR